MAGSLPTVVPREQIGVQTGAAFDFQYVEAALACLRLIAERDTVCVYCEWHDDYVVERNDGTLKYEFHQVKTRGRSKAAWPLNEIFGVVRAKKGKRQAAADQRRWLPSAEISIAERLLDHHRKFDTACALFVFVSTHDVAGDEFSALVSAAREAESKEAGISALDASQRALFDDMLAAYQSRDSAITEQNLWCLLTRVRFELAQGRFGEPKVAIGLMGQLIHEVSEVSLGVVEQSRLAQQLLSVVRAKSHTVLPENPLPEPGSVVSRKAVNVDELLPLLPLSVDGFHRLRAGDKNAAKTLSRLHRLCRDAGMSSDLISGFCDLKLAWDEWLSRHRDTVSSDVLLVIQEHARILLSELVASASKTKFTDLRNGAIQALSVLKATHGMPSSLDERVLLGGVLALAAAREGQNV